MSTSTDTSTSDQAAATHAAALAANIARKAAEADARRTPAERAAREADRATEQAARDQRNARRRERYAAATAVREERRRKMAAGRVSRVRESVQREADRDPVTAEQIEAEAAALPLVGGWTVETLDQLRRDARSVSKSSLAPPADDLVGAALVRAYERRPQAVADLTSTSVHKREAAHAYLRAAMRSVAGTAVRAALVPGALVDEQRAPDAADERRGRLVAAALAADEAVDQPDRDQARGRVLGAQRLVAVTDRMGEAAGHGAVARSRAPFGKVRETTSQAPALLSRGSKSTNGQTRLIREASLERMLYNGARPNSRPLEGGGSMAGGKAWHADADTGRAERAAERAAVADALTLDNLPMGREGSLTRDVWQAAAKLVNRMSAEGWLRRAAGLQREADMRHQAAAPMRRKSTDQDAAPSDRKRAKIAADAADRDVSALRAGALVLVGAVGAAEGRPLDLVALVAAATDVSREGRPNLDTAALAAALGLVPSDPVRKALRNSLRNALACPGALVPGVPLVAGAAAAGAAALSEAHLVNGGAVGRWSALRDQDRARRERAAVTLPPARLVGADRAHPVRLVETSDQDGPGAAWSLVLARRAALADATGWTADGPAAAGAALLAAMGAA